MAEKAKVGDAEKLKAEPVGEEPAKPEAPTRDEENERDRENHRYHIAWLLIGGMLFLLFFPVVYKNYDKAGDLAAIFSGWIGSVIGFYFLQQNTEKAQQQTTIAAKDAAEARKEVVSVAAEARKEAAGAAKTQVNLASVASNTSFEWKKMFEEAYQSRAFYEGLYEETNKSKNNYKGLYEEAQTLINEMLQELDGDAGGDD